VSYNRRSTILDLKAEGVLKVWHDYRLGHTLDLSGNSNHGTFGAAVDQLFTRQGLTVPFDGRGIGTPTIDLTGTAQLSVVFAARQLRSAANEIFVEFSPNQGSETTGFLIYQNSAAQIQVLCTGDIGLSSIVFPVQDMLGDGQMPYMGVSYDKALNVGAIKVYRDGVYVNATLADVNTNNFGDHSLFFGARNRSTLPCNSMLQGIILVSRVLTADEHLSVYKELAYP